MTAIEGKRPCAQGSRIWKHRRPHAPVQGYRSAPRAETSGSATMVVVPAGRQPEAVSRQPAAGRRNPAPLAGGFENMGRLSWSRGARAGLTLDRWLEMVEAARAGLRLENPLQHREQSETAEGRPVHVG